MFCPKCGTKTKVIESREVEEEVFRNRKCPNCGYSFYTEEFESEESKDGLRYIWAEKAKKRRRNA